MQPIVVYKLGGSLLDHPELGRLLQARWHVHPARGVLIVVGGGRTADLVRNWDKVYQLGDKVAHELALDAMALNESLVQRLLPGGRSVRSPKQAHAAVAEGCVGILCASCFLNSAAAAFPAAPELPQNWRTTSDSIAAWAAHVLGAAELVLLKSAPLPAGIDLAEAARRGLVDEHFPEIAQRISEITWVNVRATAAMATPMLGIGNRE
jgi:5-(aminomethyl)-3-furanmethanol phosphate kinase